MQCRSSFLIFLLLAFVAKRSGGLRQGHYIVVAPGTVRSNTPYHVSVSLSDFHQSAWFRISLKGQHMRNVHKTVEIQPLTTQLVALQVPRLSFGEASLVLMGFNGILARHEARVSVESQNFQVYIQTDKPRYRPGQLVRFRVICVDELIRPMVLNDVFDVLVYDADGNLVRKMGNITLTQGVFKGRFQLAEHTLVGTWKISVEASGYQMKKKSFEVSKYVLPLFTVQIVTKSDVSVLDGDVKISVKAAYAHGEPVKGNLSVNFSVKHRFKYSLERNFSREIPFDGDHVISLDMEMDIRITRRDLDGRSLKLCVINVEAQLTDSVTKQIVRERATIAVHSSPGKIRVGIPKYFHPEIPVHVKVSVTDLQNNPVRDIGKSPVNIWAKPSDAGKTDLLATIFLNDKGIATTLLNLTNTEFVSYEISAEYGGYTSRVEEVKLHSETAFSLDVPTLRAVVGEELVVQVRSRSAIEHFVYEIVSHGNILQASRINVPEGLKSYLLPINITHAMIPKISLYVHRVQGRRLDSALEHIHIGEDFQNAIEIDVDREVYPGASVSLNVSTDGGSYVGLLGVDKRLLSDIERDKDFAEDRIFSRMAQYDAVDLNEKVNPGSAAGLVTFSNTVDTLARGDSVGPKVVHGMTEEDDAWDIPAVPRIRRIFSDGWLFDDFERTPEGGLQLQRTVPDEITCWAINGFSLNPITGLSFTKSPAFVRVSRSFFISMDVPTLVREGEIVEIPVYVFNNNKADAQAFVTVESQNENLVVLNNFTDTHMTISGLGRVKFSFLIKPLKAGLFNLTARATSSLGSDALQKTIFVVSQGVPHLISKTYLLHLLEESQQDYELLVSIPEIVVEGSKKVEMLVVGDIFGPLMQCLWDLVKVPYGNGREMITHFISNLLVLKYLKAFNVTNASLERRAQVFLESGYQSLLTLKHLDGSFSFFDRSTRNTGDAMHTAIVMWGLQQARTFIQVDDNVMSRGLSLYLKSRQDTNGAFLTGTGLEDDVSLTALALLSFMEDNSNANATLKGLNFLYSSLDDVQCPVSAAISKYVLVKGGHEKSAEILSQMSAQGRVRAQVQWERPTTLQGTLETTSESFLDILQAQEKPIATILPLVSALLSSGASEKIPTHLLALDAMIQVAQDLDFGTRDLNIHLEGDQGDKGDVEVNSSNVHVLQTVEFNGHTRKVRLRMKGKGFAVVRINSQYKVPRENRTSSIFQTNVTVSERRGFFLSLKVCVSTRTSAVFTVLEVSLPTGYTLLEEMGESSGDSHKPTGLKTDSGAGSVQVNLKEVGRIGICIQLDAWMAFRLLSTNEVSVTAYDFYDEAQRTTVYHELDFAEDVM